MNNMVLAKGLFSKTDLMLYGTSILLGALLVVANYQMSAAQESIQRSGMVDEYMQQIISRMDMVSGQLSAWGNMDIKQYQR